MLAFFLQIWVGINQLIMDHLCVCVCVRACVRACACMHACMAHIDLISTFMFCFIIFQSEEIFLDMFEDEYRDMQVRCLAFMASGLC